MKSKKIIFLFFGLVSLVFSLNEINSTYAKYATKSVSKSEFNVARWDIIVNDEHIKNSEEQITEITPNYIDNDNVAAGVIAPGSVGYFDLTIDGSQTDVSFDFDISVAAGDDSSVSDLRIMKYYINTIDNLSDATEGTIINGSININDTSRKKIIRVYVIWEEENGAMTNEDDSAVGHDAENQNANVFVKINFRQSVDIPSNEIIE